METYNIAQFLGKLKGTDRTRGHIPVYPGDVLVVDEATQVSTEDALRIVQVARQCGAMVVATFDPEQLGAVDAGGIFRLIAARHGEYRLAEVRRFTHAWEREASLRLRDGDVSVLAEYDARGRIYHGPQDRVYDDAVSLYLNGYLSGKDALLMATSNATAVKLAGLVRERLAELGKVGDAEITLADGNRAGRGDLVRARLNTRIDADGQTLANRDVVRVESINDSGFGRLAVVRRQTGPGQWSQPFHVPVTYLESDAELAYAGNVHVAEGAHRRPGPHGDRRRSEPQPGLHGRDPGPGEEHSPRGHRRPRSGAAGKGGAGGLHRGADRQAGRAAGRRVGRTWPARCGCGCQTPPSERQLAPWEAVLAQALQQDEPERTALEVIQQAQDYTTHTGHLLELQDAFWRLDVVPQIDEMVRQRVTPAEYERYRRDPERPAFLQQLRTHEIGGRRIEDVLDSITAEPLDGARSIAAVLHGRTGKEPAPPRGMTAGWAERAPRNATAETEAAARMLDARQVALGERLALRPPEWAINAWGMPPARAGQATGRLAAAGRAGRVLPGGGRDHRPQAGDRPCTGREGAPGRGVPRQRARPGAARRGGPAEGDEPRAARGHGRRARPGSSHGARRTSSPR